MTKNKVLKQLVKARIRAASDNLMISIGSRKNLTKKQILDQVNKNSRVGKQIMRMQLDYLQDLASGKIQNA